MDDTLGVCNADQADKVFRNNLLAAGCASGIAAGFNAPIAGLFFALESVQSNYGPEEARARGPPMQLLAAVLAATVSQLGLGSSPAVDLEFFGWVPARSLWELPFFILLGLLCGLVAASLRYLRQVWKKAFAGAEDAGVPRFLFPIVAGIVVAIVTFSQSTKEVLYKGFANVNLVLEYADGGKQPPAFTGGLQPKNVQANLAYIEFHDLCVLLCVFKMLIHHLEREPLHSIWEHYVCFLNPLRRSIVSLADPSDLQDSLDRHLPILWASRWFVCPGSLHGSLPGRSVRSCLAR